jgi:O-antigen/teichoic acid export membrane protein
MNTKWVEKLLQPLIKSEEDRARLSTVILPSFIVRSGYFLLAYLTMIVLTRTMGSTRYGIYSYTTAIIFVLMNFSSYGFEVTAVRFTATYLSKGQKNLWKGLYNWSCRSLLLTSTIMASATVLSLWLSVFVFHFAGETPYTIPLMVSCSIIPVYAFVNFFTNLLRGQHKLLLSFLPDNTVKPLFLLIALVLYRLLTGTMRLRVAIGLNIVSFVVVLIFVIAVFRRGNTWKGIKAEYDRKTWRKFVSSIILLSCVTSLSRLDIIMLGSLKDSSQVGIYYAAERVASSLLFFLYVMNMVIQPSIAKLNALEDKEKLQRMITRTIRWVMLFSLPVFIGIIAFSKYIMLLSGPQFASGQTALIIICCGQLVDIAFGPVRNLALMTGHEKYNTIYMGIGILINFGLNLVLTPRMGLNGTAIANVTSYIFWNAAMFITLKKKTGIRTWIFG